MRGVSAIDLASKPNTEGGTAGTAKLCCGPSPPPNSGRLCGGHAHTKCQGRLHSEAPFRLLQTVAASAL